MAENEQNVWTERKRRVREKPSGRVYDRARSRALSALAKAHPDEYQTLLERFRKAERRKVKAALKNSQTEDAA